MDFFDAMLLARLGIKSDNHGKRPEVVIFLSDKNWLLLIESVAGWHHALALAKSKGLV